MAVVSKYKSPTSRLETGAELAILYVFAKLFTDAIFVATVLTLVIEPPTKLTLAISVPT